MNVGKRFARALTPVLLSALLLAGAPTSSAQSSSARSASSDSVVVLTAAEADSILAALDNQEVRLQLLQVDLDECRALARLDSLQAQAALAAAHQPWYERIVRHPIVWFSLGVFVAVSAQNLQ